MDRDVFDKFTKNARTILIEAEKISRENGEPLSSKHILLAIVKIPGTLSHDILHEYSVTYDQINLLLSIESVKRRGETYFFSDESKEILSDSFKIALSYDHYNVDTEHLLLSMVSNEKLKGYDLIKKTGIDPSVIKSQLISIFRDLAEMDLLIKEQAMTHLTPSGEEPQPPQDLLNNPEPPLMTQGTKIAHRKQKLLDYFAIDLVKKAQKNEIDPVQGRELEITRAIRILLRRTKNNPVFIGEPGVGKTAIVEGLASRIAAKDVPEPLSFKKILQLDLGLLVAGTMYRGQFEDRLKKVIEEVKSDKNIILFVDEIHSIVGTGSAEGSMDAANLLKPALSKGEIRLIGATTIEEYRKFVEKDPALERRLQSIIVKEPSTQEAIEILKKIKPLYEKHHSVKISEDAIESAVKLSEKYQREKFLPDKAIDLIDEAAAEINVQRKKDESSVKLAKINSNIEKTILLKERLITEEKFEEAAKAKETETKLKAELEKVTLQKKKGLVSFTIEKKDIAKIISQVTGIPIGNIEEDEVRKFLGIEKALEKFIAGQSEAIKEVSKAIRRNRSGIREQNKPIGSFIFLGPSGVGKTEVARVLAEHFYMDKNSLIKIDMSEFMERHSVAQLTGAPPGYVGYEDSGKLTEKVRRNPYSIILFDEIEKAHPEVFNILLQILDEGILTDARGKTVDFRNTIIIMTSNIGLEEYKTIKKIGFDLSNQKEPDREVLKDILSDKLFDVFRPELINRLDKIIVFDALSREDLRQIAKIQIQKLQDRLRSKEIQMTCSEDVFVKLASSCEDPTFGARPLIREISEKIENEIGDKILSRQIKAGDSLKIGFINGKYKFTKA